jgi:hypothetical protein
METAQGDTVVSNGSVSDIDKIRKDLLWGEYVEFRTHARHSETLRSNVNNYLLLSASGLITVIAFGNGIQFNDIYLSVLLIIVGIAGALFSSSYIERYQRNRQRALQIAKKLDMLFLNNQVGYKIGDITMYADGIHYKNKIYAWIRDWLRDTHWLWLMFPGAVILIGLAISILALTANFPKCEAF